MFTSAFLRRVDKVPKLIGVESRERRVSRLSVEMLAVMRVPFISEDEALISGKSPTPSPPLSESSIGFLFGEENKRLIGCEAANGTRTLREDHQSGELKDTF